MSAGEETLMAGIVVLTYDGSEDARHAIAVAGELRGGRPAVVVHVQVQIPPPMIGAAPAGPTEDEAVERYMEARSRRVLDEGLDLASKAGFEPEGVNRIADGVAGVWHAIIEVARERDAELIVVGHRGLSRIKSALLGSVSNGVVNHSSVPVLTVPATGGTAG
jgi:nucleotide-binding universal stress UspA family protein